MRWLGSRVLGENGVREGAVGLGPEGRVEAIEDDPPTSPDARGLVVPAPVNAHTHLADRAARGRARGLPLEAAVAPPDGLKHRWLGDARHADLVDSFRRGLDEVDASGARLAIDFREQGPDGARVAREAAQAAATEVAILGRPSRPDAWEDEAPDLLDVVDGLGVSGLADQPYSVCEAQAAWCNRHDLWLGLHLSEGERENLDAALALEPDLLVHGTHFTPRDARRVADEGVPLVLCPRSNALFGNRPPVDALLDAGVSLALGTDNAMFHAADVWAEAAALVEMGVPAQRAVRIACRNPLDATPRSSVEPGEPVVLLDDADGLDRALAERRITVPWREHVAEPRS